MATSASRRRCADDGRYHSRMNALRGVSTMASVQPAPTIVEQVYRTILDAICDGRLAPGERLTQASVAQKLSVSRQPVSQALLLLKQQKFVSEAGRRRLIVELMQELWNHLRRAMREVLQHREYRKAIWVEHGEILRAISSRDGEAAASLVRAHLSQAAINVQVVLPESGLIAS